MSSIVNVFVLMSLLLASGCATGKIMEDEVEDEAINNIDYTLYDLTYIEGVKQKLNGNFGEALDKFEEALEINPGSDAANYEISRITAMRRDYDNALKYGSRAAMIDKENPWYMMNMANIYIDMAMLDSAGMWMEKAINIDPGNENEKFRLGNLYLQNNQLEKAEGIFEEFYLKYGGNEQILTLLINTKISLGKYSEAEEILRKEEKLNPEDLNINGMMAELFRKTGDRDKADKMYELLFEKRRPDLALSYSYIDFMIENDKHEDLLEKALLLAADSALEKEEKLGLLVRMMNDSLITDRYPDKLIEIGKIVTGKDKDDPALVLTMAEIYGITGDKAQEIKTLADYVDKNEENYYLWENLLLKLNESDDIDMMYRYASKAARLFNTAPLPKILLAYSMIEKEMYDDAGEELRKVRILVNNEDQYMVQILAMEAEIEYRKGDMKNASKKFDKALEIEEDNPMILNNYAYYLAEEGQRLDDALKMIEKCIEQEENITYLDTYAWVLYKLKRYREAERVMNRIFSSGSIEDAELLEHYGFIKRETGNCEEAVVLWQSALRIDKKKTYLIEEIRKCLEKN